MGLSIFRQFLLSSSSWWTFVHLTDKSNLSFLFLPSHLSGSWVGGILIFLALPLMNFMLDKRVKMSFSFSLFPSTILFGWWICLFVSLFSSTFFFFFIFDKGGRVFIPLINISFIFSSFSSVASHWAFGQCVHPHPTHKGRDTYSRRLRVWWYLANKDPHFYLFNYLFNEFLKNHWNQWRELQLLESLECASVTTFQSLKSTKSRRFLLWGVLLLLVNIVNNINHTNSLSWDPTFI